MELPAFVGRYEIRDEIASGGFATVLRAWDEDLASFVALKLLRAELAEHEEIRQRFLQEARLLRRVRSHSVVAVHDIGRLGDGRPYFVMDYADGGTLVPRLRARDVSDAEARAGLEVLIDGLADGLSAIHEAEIVHRDVKPANILFQRMLRAPGAAGDDRPRDATLVGQDERVLVGDLGIAKDLASRLTTTTAAAGTPVYQAPEQSEPSAEVTPAADVYAATATLWHVLTGRRPPSAADAAGRLAELPHEWREPLATGMAERPARRFRGMEAWRDAMQEALATGSRRTSVLDRTEAGPRAPRCPFKGLAAFQPEDAAYFHGREALVEEMLGRLRLDRILVVGGSSGSGKSSLLRAGLVPALRAGALPGSERWHVALFTPGRDPLSELYMQLLEAQPSGHSAVALDQLVAYPGLARHLASAAGDLILCVDQTEELFTLAAPDRRSRFIEALSAMTDPADSRVRLVLALRADFYAASAEVPWLAGRISQNQILVGPMTAPELRRAIVEPARLAGLRVERALVDAIVDEAGSRPGSLPLVAHALYETWIRREGDTLTLAAFQEAGGVAGAISQTADALYEQRFTRPEQEATKRLFLRLTSPGENAPDTRRLLPLPDLGTDPDPLVMGKVVRDLTEARLLTVDERSVQLAHEALLRTWPRLRRWIEENRDELRMRQRIARDAAEWAAEGRDADPLYRGGRLMAALEWAERNPDQLGRLDREFLDAAVAARDRDAAAAAERDRRRRRVRRLGTAGLAALALGATAASLVAFRATREAEENRARAEAASAVATERFAAALGAAASSLARTDPLLALALGAEAVARAASPASTYEARAAMLDARRTLSEPGVYPVGSPVSVGDALSMAMTADGSVVALGQREGPLDLYDVAGRRWLARGLTGHASGVRDLAFDPSGTLLASAGADGAVRLWSLDPAGAAGVEVIRIDDVAFGVAFDPSADRLAAALGDGTVRLHDTRDGSALGPPLAEEPFAFKTLAFTEDGRELLAANIDGKLFGWSLPSRAPAFPVVSGLASSDPVGLAVGPAGRRLALVGANGSVSLVSRENGPTPATAFGAEDDIAAVVFTGDGERLLGGDASGRIRVWDLGRQRLVGEPVEAHGQGVLALAAGAGGSLLASLGRDQQLRFWQVEPDIPVATTLEVAGERLKGLAFSPDGRRLAAGSASGLVRLWDPSRDAPPTVLRGHAGEVWAVAFSADGALLASGDRDGEIALWEVDGGRRAGRFRLDCGAIWSLHWTDGGTLVAAGASGLRLLDPRSGRVEPLPRGTGADLTRAAVSRDGRLLAASATDGSVELWDLRERRSVLRIEADDNAVWSVAFSPDGRTLATASSDEVVALWEIPGGARIAVFGGHMGGATDVAFLADGATLVASDRTGAMHWWDIVSGRRLTRAVRLDRAPVWRLAPHPLEVGVASSSDAGTVRIWDQLAGRSACRIGSPALDEARRVQYLGGEGTRSACRDPDGGP